MKELISRYIKENNKLTDLAIGQVQLLDIIGQGDLYYGSSNFSEANWNR